MKTPAPWNSRFARKIAYALSASICLGALPAAAQTYVQQHGQLSVQGTHLADQNGQPVALHGMVLYWDQWAPKFYNNNCVKWLRDDWNCKVVRASIAVTEGGYLSNPTTSMNRAKAVIQSAIDQGIYVIVDWHENDSNANLHIPQARNFFREIAQTYGQYPNVIYEPWNEPLNTHPWETVIKPYFDSIIPTIRMYDPDNIIVVGTRVWDQAVDEASRSPLRGYSNLVYSITAVQDKFG